jgi:L,D-transpeptidase YcbB
MYLRLSATSSPSASSVCHKSNRNPSADWPHQGISREIGKKLLKVAQELGTHRSISAALRKCDNFSFASGLVNGLGPSNEENRLNHNDKQSSDLMPSALARKIPALLVALTVSTAWVPATGQAQVSPFMYALAEASAKDTAIAEFYRARDYAPLWTGAEDAARRTAFLSVLVRASDHGLPVERYDAAALIAAFQSAKTHGDIGRVEARMTKAFLDYARDIRTGVLEPKKVDAGIVRDIARDDPLDLLARFVASEPAQFLNSLPPRSADYARLLKAKIDLEHKIAAGGWGERVPASVLRPGASGAAVVALRDRLVRMGYLRRSATQTYDAAIEKAVQDFQIHHGLPSDGIATESTLAELNVAAETRLKSIIVAMERLRWLDDNRGKRHVWVNIPDFTAKVIDDGKVTFVTRSVVGKNVPDQRTPEFSDNISFMVINPSWSVPRSIAVKEYLPLLKRNPGAVSHLALVDSRGKVVNRGAVNFGNYTERNFPYAMRQAPSQSNALGLVKFMFPNPHNIYLHDTPSKSLFERDERAFSHGCIRLAQPFDFAHTLLSVQSDDAESEFDRHLKTGRETNVKLQDSVPVHLVYFTAFPTAKGQMTYRRDVYGRDAALFQALQSAGVVLGGVQG